MINVYNRLDFHKLNFTNEMRHTLIENDEIETGEGKDEVPPMRYCEVNAILGALNFLYLCR